MNLILIKKMLEEEERFVPHVYKDSRGIFTIGIGHMVDERLGGGISYEIAQAILDEDVEVSIASLNVYIPWWTELDEVRQLILVDMCFNLGIKKLLKFRNTLAAIKNRNWDAAADGMRNSLWYQQTKRRARRLVAMMETGRYIPMSEVR